MNSLNRPSSSLRAVWKERNGVRKGDETDLSETQDEFQQEVRGKPKAGSGSTRGWVSFEGCIGGCGWVWVGGLGGLGWVGGWGGSDGDVGWRCGGWVHVWVVWGWGR